jgi:hypothetical protein
MLAPSLNPSLKGSSCREPAGLDRRMRACCLQLTRSPSAAFPPPQASPATRRCPPRSPSSCPTPGEHPPPATTPPNTCLAGMPRQAETPSHTPTLLAQSCRPYATLAHHTLSSTATVVVRKWLLPGLLHSTSQEAMLDARRASGLSWRSAGCLNACPHRRAPNRLHASTRPGIRACAIPTSFATLQRLCLPSSCHRTSICITSMRFSLSQSLLSSVVCVTCVK